MLPSALGGVKVARTHPTPPRCRTPLYFAIEFSPLAATVLRSRYIHLVRVYVCVVVHKLHAGRSAKKAGKYIYTHGAPGRETIADFAKSEREGV